MIKSNCKYVNWKWFIVVVVVVNMMRVVLILKLWFWCIIFCSLWFFGLLLVGRVGKDNKYVYVWFIKIDLLRLDFCGVILLVFVV